MDNQIAPPHDSRRVGMDMVAPYGVYLDGFEVNVYETQVEARREFEALRRRLLRQRAEAPVS